MASMAAIVAMAAMTFAVAELGQAQLKFGLDFNQIWYTFGLSKFDLVELVGYILGLTDNIWFGTFRFSEFCSD